MPRPRKPLIEPNILPSTPSDTGEETGDVLSRIIAGDRARRQPAPEEPEESALEESALEESVPEEPQAQTQDRDARFQQAMALADAPGEFVVATFRLPAKLNDYLDRYVARMNEAQSHFQSQNRPKRRYRKIDAVTEAFAAFYASHPLPPAAPDEI